MPDNPLIAFKKYLPKLGITVAFDQNSLNCSLGEKQFSCLIAGEDFNFDKSFHTPVIPVDYLVRDPQKMAALVLSKLQANKKIFARKCEVKKVDKTQTIEFLNKYHLMNATQSAYNLGLYYEEELVALATFSKGRKMDRLPEELRSFELIRFCCRSGITVTGGLTRLIKTFCAEKNAGDIMTYVDKQVSDGKAFITAGFKKTGETEANYFLIDKTNFNRMPWKKEDDFDVKQFYLTQNTGNLKLIYTPHV